VIEVHVVHTPDRDPPLDGIMRLLRREPVRIRVVIGSPGRLGFCRAKAIAESRATWVSWVDPDDRIEPGLYRILAEAVQPGARMVHCWEWEHPVDGGPPKLNQFAHHGLIVRRDAALPLLPTVAEAGDKHPELALQALRPCVTVPWPGYHWHRRVGSARSPCRLSLQRAGSRLAPPTGDQP
jgi:hypothetical protein